MRWKDIVTERYLHSEATFGFELEAIYNGDDPSNDLDTVKKIIKQYFPEMDISLQSDASIKTDYDKTAFEWACPPLNLTPETLKRIIKFLAELPGHNITTNRSCGFHVHLKFPQLDDGDRVWLILNLANDTDMRKDIVYFKDYIFIDDEYANDAFLVFLEQILDDAEAKHEINYKALNQWISTEKYRNIRIHPQGTLEWRGPRDFLDKSNMGEIKEFFLLLWKFVGWMSHTLGKRTLRDFSRDEWLKTITGFEKPSQKEKFEELIEKVKKNPKIIAKIHDERLQLKILERLPEYLKYAHPSPELEFKVARLNSWNFEYLIDAGYKFSNEALIKVIQWRPTQIALLKHPPEEVQMAAIQTDPSSFWQIKGPSEKVRKYFKKLKG